MKKRLFILLFASLCLVACGKSKAQQSVDSYLENSRKAAFVDTLVQYCDVALKEVNIGVKYKLYEINTLYLIPAGNNKNYSCLQVESGGQSPYSDDWNYLYVGVTYDGKGYDYYVIGEDKAGHGVTFYDKFTIINGGEEKIYTESKVKTSGYDKLNNYYKGRVCIIFEIDGQNSFTQLFNLTNGEKLNKIVIIGAEDCSYKG